MQIPRSLLDSLTDEVNALSEAGQQMVLNALANAEWSSVAELRATMSEVMGMVCSEIADLSAARAAGFYDEVRRASVGKRLGALAESGYSSAANDGAVRALVQSVVDTGSTDRFARDLTARVDYEAKRAAGECVERNARRDPLKPKWARVPSDAETCSFCLMLASRGFAYRSEETAGGSGHYHPHCDCRIVPGFDGMEVEGYDPGELYRAWRRAEVEQDARKIERGYKAAWNGYRKAKTPANYENTVGAFLDGLSGKGSISAQFMASLEPHEIQAAKWLSSKGHDVLFLYASSLPGSHTPDVLIDGELWEIKRISSSSARKAKQRIGSAAAQSDSVVLDASLRTLSQHDIDSVVTEMLGKPDIRRIMILTEDEYEIRGQ